MKTKTFNVYTDAGHGWVKVLFKTLIELNIWQDITQYSYVRGEYCFLEEDCDAATLINALRDKGIEPRWRVNHSDKQSKIRSYARYIPPVKVQS